MWIKTKGGYLLNTDRIDYFTIIRECTYAYSGNQPFMITDENIISSIAHNLNRGTTVMEVK